MTTDDTPPPAEARISRDAEIRDHLANERTLLAWQRTAIAMVGIGFLIARFALDPADEAITGSLLGAALILAGGMIAIVGTYRFIRTEREIDTGSYRPAILAHLVLSATVAVAAIALAAYAILSPG